MRIIGIDPGMAITGYSIVDVSSNDREESFSIAGSGSIQTDKKLDASSRLLEIFQDITELLQTYKPDVAAIEQIFFFKNAKTIVPVCEARGVILMCVKMQNIPVYEYTPLVVKQTITGYGRSDKDDVKQMIKIMLNQEDLAKLDDTNDATAIAICHIRHQNFNCNISS